MKMICRADADSTSAFIAAEVAGPGEAVTSLGSTFAPKLLSKQRVDNALYGVYSQRIGDSWLLGKTHQQTRPQDSHHSMPFQFKAGNMPRLMVSCMAQLAEQIVQSRPHNQMDGVGYGWIWHSKSPHHFASACKHYLKPNVIKLSCTLTQLHMLHNTVKEHAGGCNLDDQQLQCFYCFHVTVQQEHSLVPGLYNCQYCMLTFLWLVGRGCLKHWRSCAEAFLHGRPAERA